MLRLPNSTYLYFDLNFAKSTFEICQVYPPIEKMDASLAQLQCCVKLSLSTNMIVNIQVIITNIYNKQSPRTILL